MADVVAYAIERFPTTTRLEVELCMRRFTEAGTQMLCMEGISPRRALLYPRAFYRAEQVVDLWKLGITSKDIDSFDVNILYNVLSSIHAFRSKSPSVMATGKNSIVFMVDDAIWKFGQKDILHWEHAVIDRIHRKGAAPHIVGLAGVMDGYLRLQPVRGEPLDSLIKSRTFSADEALNCGRGLVEGLIEMRHGGIMYHRDLRPANIIMGEEPVIIDFATATASRHPFPKGFNRRYGGMNDLVSVGQIMYRMVAGRHLFNNSSMHETLIADGIAAQRQAVYGDPEMLRRHLNAVDGTAGAAAPAIKALLTAENHEYKSALRLF